MPVGKKKTIKRKPKGGATPDKYYFNAGTQAAICAYQDEPDVAKRNQIYVTGIMPALQKLAENLINVYGYQVQYETKADLQAECVEFLYGILNKWDRHRGTMAFSYFNIVAKHWLIVESKRNIRQLHTFTSLDDAASLNSYDLEAIDTHNTVESPEQVMITAHEAEKIKVILKELRDRAATDNEKACMDGIDTLFREADNLDFLNKRAVMVYLRSLTTLNPKSLSVVLSSLKRHYKDIKQELAD